MKRSFVDWEAGANLVREEKKKRGKWDTTVCNDNILCYKFIVVPGCSEEI